MRYPILRTIVALQYVFAIVAMLMSWFAAAKARSSYEGVISLVAGAGVTVMLIAFAEVLKLLIDIEANTRAAATAASSGPERPSGATAA